MIKYIKHIWFGLPMQLLLLHFKRYQVFLVLWYIIFAALNGSFMKPYGADALFLAPEYFNSVSSVSTAIVGFALGVFIMSWNVTTFILNGYYVSFLATTAQPFLKYCINNSLLPLSLIFTYIGKSILFEHYQELLSFTQIVLLSVGFIFGFLTCVFISFIYFFGADKTIYLTIKKDIQQAHQEYKQAATTNTIFEKHYFKVTWFYSARLKRRIPRDINHYDNSIIKKVLSRHHFAAVISIISAYIFLILIGFVSNNKFFQIPAAASLLIFFALLIAAVGAFSLFFKKWSLLVILFLYFGINYLYKKDLIDPKNKAYGLNYNEKSNRPIYNEAAINLLHNKDSVAKDIAIYTTILNNWKAKQKDSLPVMFIINTSGGGLRSATFTFNVLQQLNKQLNNHLLHKTLFINGASGGMLGATYFRQLCKNKSISINDEQWLQNISTDLLNPIFSSAITTDIIGPVQKFEFNNNFYNKDRGYAFEQKLNENTHNILDISIEDYRKDELQAKTPFIFLNSVITRDARKMIIASNPARFMMKPLLHNVSTSCNIDALDFTSYFKNLDAGKLKLTSALRMNATFPYALPNVWLPCNPVIDVMDAGIRDNYGGENTFRFLNVFKEWILKNTSKVVILHLRDRPVTEFDDIKVDNEYVSFITKPLAAMQNNWFGIQDFNQAAQMSYLNTDLQNKVEHIYWQYIPLQNKDFAGLSFHLTSNEKRNIMQSVNNADNLRAFKLFEKYCTK